MDYATESQAILKAVLNVYENWNTLADPAQCLRSVLYSILSDLAQRENLEVDLSMQTIRISEPCLAIYWHYDFMSKPDEALRDCIHQGLRIMVELDSCTTLRDV